MNPFLDVLLRAHPAAEAQLRPWYAFADEVALAPRKVTEPAIGQIRLKWWAEAADEVLDVSRNARAHPAVTGWDEALKTSPHKPAPGLIHAYINAHTLDLEKQPYADFEALRADATARWGNLLRVGLQLLEVRDESHHHAANHVGAGFGLVNSLYGIATEATLGRQSHPELPTGFETWTAEDRAQVGEHTLGQAVYHIERALELLPKAENQALPVLRMGLAAKALVKAAARAGADPLALPPVQHVAQTFVLRLTWSRVRGTYA